MIKRIFVLIFIGLLFACCETNNSLQENELTKDQIDSFKRIDCDSLLKELGELKADTFGRVKSIPHDFEGCLAQLDSSTSDKMKEWIRCLPDGEFSGYVHHGYGMYLRNNWGLWSGSGLAKNLAQMGILHPDDMTGIILDSFQRRLKGEDIKLDEQLKYYQDFWRDHGIDVDSILNGIDKEKNKNTGNTNKGHR